MADRDSPTAGPPPSEAPRHLGAGAALSVIANAGPLVAATVLSVVLARSIGPAANGTYALLLNVVNLAVLVFSFGLATGVTYEVSRRIWPVRQAFRETYLAALGLGLVGAAAGFGFYALTRDSVMRSVDTDLALVALLSIPAFIAWQFAQVILLARDRYEGYAVLQLTSSAVMVVAAIALALPFGLMGAVAGLAASGFVTAALGGWLLRRWIRKGIDEGVRQPAGEHGSGHLRRAFPFGLKAWVGNVIQQANYRLDLLILGAYAATSEVGKYSVAVTLMNVAWILPQGLQQVLFPRTARLHADTEAGEVTAGDSDAALSRTTRHSVLLMLPAGIGVVLLIALVPLVYGRAFRETVWLGLVLLPGVLLLGVGKVLASGVSGRGRPELMMYAALVGGAVTLALYFVLIPPFEEWGAAVASSFSYFLTTLITLWFFRRLTGFSLRATLIPTRADVRNYREALVALRAYVARSRASA